MLTAGCAGGSGLRPDGPVGESAPTEGPAPAAAEAPAASPASVLPDVTARTLSAADLAAMLPAGDTGPAATGEEPSVEERGNGALLTATLGDRDDEAADLERYGRRFGVAARYPQGEREAHVWIDLLADPAAAHGYLLDTAGDAVKGLGGTHHPGALAADVTEFPVDALGDEALGLRIVLEDGRFETAVLYRMGRLVVFASLVTPQEADHRVAAQYLAAEVEGRILGVLVEGEALPDPGPGPDRYRFEFAQTATAGGDSWTAAAVGVVADGALSCRVEVEGPGISIDRDLVLAGGRLWGRDHGAGDYRALGGGSLADRALLAYCPGWPVDAAAAGLTPVLGGSAVTHTLDGQPVVGFVGDAPGLATVLGVPDEGLTVGAFTVWIGSGTPWVIDLRIEAAGPGAALGRLVAEPLWSAPEVQIEITQRVSDLGSAGPVHVPGITGQSVGASTS